MKIKDLKEKIKDLPDDMQVILFDISNDSGENYDDIDAEVADYTDEPDSEIVSGQIFAITYTGNGIEINTKLTRAQG